MNRVLTIIIVLSAMLLPSCGDKSVDMNDLPKLVREFVEKYYPGVAVDYLNNSTQKCVVMLRDSATLTFDKKREWTKINGNGAILPQMLIFDQTPEGLYKYLEEIDAVNGVYCIERANGKYGVWLHEPYFEYTVATGDVEYKERP